MNESINVRTIQILTTLKNAFLAFSSETQESLLVLENELHRTLDRLKAEVDLRRRHVAACRSAVDFAERVLRECEAQEDEDYTPDCSAEIYELQEARRSLQNTQEELEISQIWFSRIQRAIEQFRTHIRRLKDLAIDRTESAKAFLDRGTGDLERYVDASPPPTTAATSSNVYPTATLATTTPPTGRVNQSGKTSDQWAERGVVMVNVADLPMPEGITNALDFRKIPIDKMKEGLKQFQEMLPVIQNGVGASKDYWAEHDRELGLDYPNGYLRIYEAFYGHDAIRVEKSGDQYEIVNGRHRIWLAKVMGIHKLPINVVELT